VAVIAKLEPIARDRELKLHPTQVVAQYGVHRRDGKVFLQIDTFGSLQRDKPGKQSQTMQLTEETARELWAIIGKEFGLSA
jgi:hypothetical protein